MSGLLQRLAHRAISGSAQFAVLPALSPRFAVALDAGEPVGVEAIDFASPRATASLQEPALSLQAEPVPSTIDVPAPVGTASAERAEVALRRDAPAPSTTPPLSAAVIPSSPHTFAASRDSTSRRTVPPPEERTRRLGWPPRETVEALHQAPRKLIAPERAADPLFTRRRIAEQEPTADAVTAASALRDEVSAPAARNVREAVASVPTQSPLEQRPRAVPKGNEAVVTSHELLAVPRLPRDPQRAPHHTIARVEGERPQESAAPVINVTIGRIDVRAVPAPAAPPPTAARALRLSLDEFLKQRSGRPR